MTAYAVAHLHDVDPSAGVVEYLERIDETLAPHSGRFIVHGGRQRVVEGPADAIVVVIEFPDYAQAEAWYDSAPYRQILGLRIASSAGTAVLAERCADDHRAPDVLAEPGHYSV